jgi:threonine synthase
MWRGVIEEYRDWLPIDPGMRAVTLGEGDTPLIEAPRLAQRVGFGGRLFLKYEGLNPTASFKDRGMTVAISVAAANRSEAVICASTGNTSASGAAYAARAGLRAVVIIPEGKIALGKLSQAVAHGATVVSIEGNFDQAMRVVTELSQRANAVIVNSVNPYRIQGQKTAAFEVCDVLARAPDYHFLPVGNAGNITAYWMGYREYADAGVVESTPRMMGFQAAGADPIVRGAVVEHPETIATAIRIGNPASWRTAEAARDESGGIIDSVTDEEILEAYRTLATSEGVFVEPASAASLAGLKKVCAADRVEDTATVVCTLTGHGLKDPTTATCESPEPLTASADTDEILRLLKL